MSKKQKTAGVLGISWCPRISTLVCEMHKLLSTSKLDVNGGQGGV